ncbi:MAG: hypothetical protein AB7F89_06765 [Pirellulaceae bacterium]
MVDFTGNLRTSAAELVIEYRLANRGTDPIYVAHVAMDVTSRQYANKAYAALSADGRRLDLLLGGSPLPLDREVECAVSALFIRVPAQQGITGEVRMDVPVLEWNGYFPPRDDIDTDPAAVREVVLTIETIAQSAATFVQEIAQLPGHFWVVGPVQATLLRFTPTATVPVRKRRGDAFPRS